LFVQTGASPVKKKLRAVLDDSDADGDFEEPLPSGRRAPAATFSTEANSDDMVEDTPVARGSGRLRLQGGGRKQPEVDRILASRVLDGEDQCLVKYKGMQYNSTNFNHYFQLPLSLATTNQHILTRVVRL
jgi:hypothetical protein